MNIKMFSQKEKSQPLKCFFFFHLSVFCAWAESSFEKNTDCFSETNGRDEQLTFPDFNDLDYSTC